ncbi:MAG TPA: ribosome biogenesis GTP-binding protein YihA/YsxC [Stellaceae bacterium]|nr:ribosome biogenesis GTP-binding protein YihA/YsxC [Stellaceae bacterium]
MSRFPDARFMLSAASPAQFPADRGVEVAFAGRSNAGKSSAINAILVRRGLARTSKLPGRTRLLNFFEIAPERRLVDLPGYGYARASDSERASWEPAIDALRERSSLRGLYLIVDARRGVTGGDLQLIAWAEPARRKVHVLLTKADKLNRTEGRSALSQASARLGSEATVQLFSALRGVGVEEAQDVLGA